MKLDETVTYSSLEVVSFCESVPIQSSCAQWFWCENWIWCTSATSPPGYTDNYHLSEVGLVIERLESEQGYARASSLLSGHLLWARGMVGPKVLEQKP